jgi:hypothetical protein
MHADDVTGTWSGSLAMTKGDETKDDSAYLILKQTGTEITGTIGPNADKRLTITKGSADGNSVYIEAIVEGDNKLVLRLKVEGDKLAWRPESRRPDGSADQRQNESHEGKVRRESVRADAEASTNPPVRIVAMPRGFRAA